MYSKAMQINSLYSYPYLNKQKLLVLPIIAYTLSLTKSEIRAKSFFLVATGVGMEREGNVGEGEGKVKGGEMIQTVYVHMNNKRKKVHTP
jgi:hypothetical protein